MFLGAKAEQEASRKPKVMVVRLARGIEAAALDCGSKQRPPVQRAGGAYAAIHISIALACKHNVYFRAAAEQQRSIYSAAEIGTQSSRVWKRNRRLLAEHRFALQICASLEQIWDITDAGTFH